MFEKIIILIGEDNLNRIKNTKILLVGVGGVGGFVLEALVRSGFEDITIIDGDKVELSNLNRQLISNIKNINHSKVEVAKAKMLDINKKVNIKVIGEFLTKDNINTLDNDFDFILDACDTLNTKLELIRYAQNNNINIIASMGVGNRVDATKIIRTTLDKTNNDPLAKKLRKLVRENDLNIKVPVVCSTEIPNKNGEVNSLITSPGISGLLMVDYVINKVIKPY